MGGSRSTLAAREAEVFIARYRHRDQVHLGVVEDETVLPLDTGSLPVHDARRLGVAALAAAGWRDNDPLPVGPPLRLSEVRLLAPVPHPEKVICVGVNYRLHADESGLAPPPFPEIFAKFPNAIQDPFAPIVLPELDDAIDYEGELAVVIGGVARSLKPQSALRSVAGYTASNDVSARTIQLRVSQWVAGKTLDTFCPIGPWVATPTSVPDPQALHLRTSIGGEMLQEGCTAEMIFPVVDLLVYLSSLMTLKPGDLVLTGTPAGVGHTRTPRRYLHEGDVVDVWIDGVGTLSNPVARRGRSKRARPREGRHEREEP